MCQKWHERCVTHTYLSVCPTPPRHASLSRGQLGPQVPDRSFRGARESTGNPHGPADAEARASIGKDKHARANANAPQQKAIRTTKAKMLCQASVDHLVRKRRQVGASRQRVLIEAPEALELCIWDTDRDHLAIAIAAQAIQADGSQDIRDVERRDA